LAAGDTSYASYAAKLKMQQSQLSAGGFTDVSCMTKPRLDGDNTQRKINKEKANAE
jgi:hypothetical protein